MYVRPHKWRVGTRFEWEFEFPMPINPFYEPKPKTKKAGKPTATRDLARKASKPAAPDNCGGVTVYHRPDDCLQQIGQGGDVAGVGRGSVDGALCVSSLSEACGAAFSRLRLSL